MKAQRKLAKHVVSALTTAGGRSERRLRRRALRNFKPVEEACWGDLFVVFDVEGRLYVSSTGIALQETLAQFWRKVSEWAWIDLQWWCEDHAIPFAVANAISPALYHLVSDELTLIETEDAYRRSKESMQRCDKQFAFLHRDRITDEIRQALSQRFAAVHAGGTPR